MPDTRTGRQRAFDNFIAEANLSLESAPTDALLSRIAEADARLYERLEAGDKWLNTQLEKHLAGHLDDLSQLREGWGDWLRLYRYGIQLIETGGHKGGPGSPSTTTTTPGPQKDVVNE